MLHNYKTLFIATLSFLFSYCLSANNNGQGYILTLDKKKIAGTITNIIYSDLYSEITFINDMGTPYKIGPFLITGFYFENENESFTYESKFYKGRWLFLRILVRGKGLNLYASHYEKKNVVQYLWGDRVVERSVKEYWLEWKGKFPIMITPLNFRKTLKSKFSKYPSLVKKIGSPGYRFKDLEKIVIEYNKSFEESGTRI